MLPEFRRRFWMPPRAHGEVIEDRTVSFLELFYDLVYVVVIGRAAHTLAGHVSWRGVGEFAVIFGLIWIAWVNGTLYYELHGREDGRTRAFVFLQMLLLVVLAVYTGEAATTDGQGFAIVYVTFLVVLSYLWYSVRRQDSEEYMATTTRYLAGMAISILAVGISIFLSDQARLLVWALVVLMWVVGIQVLARSPGMQTGVTVTDSFVERFGLFVIIVLGEVVVGVVSGLSEAERTVEVMATGLLGLSVGFAYWWTYFDFVGRKLPVENAVTRNKWLMAHLPVTMSVAAAGAAMVSLIEHGQDAATPRGTAWLLTGSVALGLMAMLLQLSALREAERHPALLRSVGRAMGISAVLALFLGWLAPAPWVLAALLVLILSALWLFAVARRFKEIPTQS